MPSVHLLPQSNLSAGFYHSVLISLLRGMAALEVAAAHLRAQVFPGYALVPSPSIWFQLLAFLTGFAHQAVVIFFLLSGWLVGGSLINKIGAANAIKDYTIDRLTRLWIVLIPTFGIILLLGIGTGALNPLELDLNLASSNEYSGAAFMGNLVGIQHVAVPSFGGNFPLWSLSNETWYYVLFPIVLVLLTTKSQPTRLLTMAACLLISYFLSAALLLYFLLWLIGAAGSRIKIDSAPLLRTLLFILFAIVSVYFRLNGKNDDLETGSFIQDVIFSVAFLAFLCSMQYPMLSTAPALNLVKRMATFFANFSFTLYVLHIPLISAMVYLSGSFFIHNRLSQQEPSHWAIYFGMFAFIIAASYLFYLPFESNTHRARSRLKYLLMNPKRAL